MLRGRSRKYSRSAAAEAAPRLCDRSGCTEPGEFRAPRSRDGKDGYHFFCLEHVREYNKAYNYFADMSPEEVENFQRSAPYGHRPTWPLGDRTGGRRANVYVHDPFGFADGPQYGPRERRREEHRYNAEQRRAFRTLELEPTDDLHEVKVRYKQLVKRFHPDANGGDRRAEDRLKRINEAYSVLSAGLS